MHLQISNCRVNVSGLTASSNITAVARQLISQCNLIQPSRLPELEQLLMYLQKRKLEKKGNAFIAVRTISINLCLQILLILALG